MEDRVQPDRSAALEGEAGRHTWGTAGCARAAGFVLPGRARSRGREIARVDRYAGHCPHSGARRGIGFAQRGRKKFAALKKKVLKRVVPFRDEAGWRAGLDADSDLSLLLRFRFRVYAPGLDVCRV